MFASDPYSKWFEWALCRAFCHVCSHDSWFCVPDISFHYHKLPVIIAMLNYIGQYWKMPFSAFTDFPCLQNVNQFNLKSVKEFNCAISNIRSRAKLAAPCLPTTGIQKFTHSLQDPNSQWLTLSRMAHALWVVECPWIEEFIDHQHFGWNGACKACAVLLRAPSAALVQTRLSE